MSETEVLNALSSDEYGRQIAIICKNGKTTTEMQESMIEYYRNRGFGKTSSNLLKGWVATKVANLENIGALVFKNNYWFTTDNAKTVLSKYLGV